MGTIISVVLGFIAVMALLSFIFSPRGKREENAAMGAVGAGIFIMNMLPTIIIIVIVVLCVRACS